MNRTNISIFLLVIMSFCLYVSSINNGVFVFDDKLLLKYIDTTSFTDILDVGSGRYWRPLTITTFYADYYFFNLSTRIMHFTNILLHITCTVLVYFVCKKIMLVRNQINNDFCLLLAAVFATHPVNSESINWISGRTDPLATVFALLGIYCFLRGQTDSNPTKAYLASSALFFLGCLAKESITGLYLAVFLVTFFTQGDRTDGHDLRTRAKRALPFLTGGGLYLLIRLYGHLAGATIGQPVVASQVTDKVLNPSIFNAVAGLGFYFKKLIWPTPLSFAIDEVSVYYSAVTILIFIGYVLIMKRSSNSLFKYFCTFLLLSIIPPLVNAAYGIAWTHYAERYLYLPTALMAATLACLSETITGRRWLFTGLASLVFLYFLPVTIGRNSLWNNPVAFIQEESIQAPDNKTLRTVIEELSSAGLLRNSGAAEISSPGSQGQTSFPAAN